MMRVDMLTREYPPHVYGGAGVHVAELARVLRSRVDVRVHCFDGPREEGGPGDDHGVRGYGPVAELAGTNHALQTFGVDLAMADAVRGTDFVNSHTWYANLAGHLGGLLHDDPHVLSHHSTEQLRPWNADQLGGRYALSSWAQRTAYQDAARSTTSRTCCRPTPWSRCGRGRPSSSAAATRCRAGPSAPPTRAPPASSR